MPWAERRLSLGNALRPQRAIPISGPQFPHLLGERIETRCPEGTSQPRPAPGLCSLQEAGTRGPGGEVSWVDLDSRTTRPQAFGPWPLPSEAVFPKTEDEFPVIEVTRPVEASGQVLPASLLTGSPGNTLPDVVTVFLRGLRQGPSEQSPGWFHPSPQTLVLGSREAL